MVIQLKQSFFLVLANSLCLHLIRLPILWSAPWPSPDGMEMWWNRRKPKRIHRRFVNFPHRRNNERISYLLPSEFISMSGTVHPGFNKIYTMLCCLKPCTPEEEQQLLLLNLHSSTRHEETCTSHPLDDLCTVCSKQSLRCYSPQVHSSCSLRLSTCPTLQPSTPTQSNTPTFTLTMLLRSRLFFSFFPALALHLISVNAQFLFSSTRRSLSSHPPSKISAQLGV